MDTFPQYPGATLAARTKFTERFPETSRTLVYVYATEDSSEQVLAFFREQLGAQSWEQQTGTKDQLLGVYSKGEAQLEVNTQSTILEPNYVDAEHVERLTDVPEDTAMIFTIAVNAR